MRAMLTVGTVLMGLSFAACGGSGTKKSHPDMAQTIDLSVVDFSEPDDLSQPGGDMSMVSPSPSPSPGTSVLTINNYLAWCDVSVDGVAKTPAQTMHVTVPTGVSITLTAAPTSVFIWGYWSGVSSGADMGALAAGSGGNHAVSITLTGDRTIGVCCPHSDKTTFGTGCP